MNFDFEPDQDVDDIIETWAKKFDLQEDCFLIGMKPDDAAYCFSYADGNARTFIAINTMDNRLYLEAWAVQNIQKEVLLKARINNLLYMLGHVSMDIKDRDGE